jgi:GNAT superfamily N-acetyltransferase
MVGVTRAIDTSDPAGSGLCPIPQARVTEPAASGVFPSYRGHGIAAALIAQLPRRQSNGAYASFG